MARPRAPRDRLKPVGPELLQTRRWLRHWHQGGAAYFLTFRAVAIELPTDLRSMVLTALRYFDAQRYTLWAAVVMPDHVHLLLTPLEQGHGQWWSVSSILHSLKAYTAKQVNLRLQRSGSVWMQESFEGRDPSFPGSGWEYLATVVPRLGRMT